MQLPIIASFLEAITPQPEPEPGVYRLELVTHAQLMDAIKWYRQSGQEPLIQVAGLVEQMSLSYLETWKMQRQRSIQRSDVLIHEPESIPGRARRKEILFVSVRQEICPPGQMYNPDWRPDTKDYWFRPARFLQARWEIISLSPRGERH